MYWKARPCSLACFYVSSSNEEWKCNGCIRSVCLLPEISAYWSLTHVTSFCCHNSQSWWPWDGPFFLLWLLVLIGSQSLQHPPGQNSLTPKLRKYVPPTFRTDLLHGVRTQNTTIWSTPAMEAWEHVFFPRTHGVGSTYPRWPTMTVPFVMWRLASTKLHGDIA